MILDAERISGPADLFVHSAVAWPNSLKGDSETVYKQAIEMNIQGTYQFTQTILDKLHSLGWGRIVLLSSGLAEDGMPGSALYRGMKSAHHGMIRVWIWDAGKAGILINEILPGLTLTNRVVEKVPEEVREKVRLQTPTRTLSRP